jgi:hypothetical protein
MGRYYSGDIEGKFMFAIQGSNAPTRFGAYETETGYVDYCIDFKEYKFVKEELDRIKTNNFDQFQKLEKLWENERGYNDDTLKKYGVTKHDLSEWADYQLGKQILEFFEQEQRDCHICAEL